MEHLQITARFPLKNTCSQFSRKLSVGANHRTMKVESCTLRSPRRSWLLQGTLGRTALQAYTGSNSPLTWATGVYRKHNVANLCWCFNGLCQTRTLHRHP
jgi:hypothetical protein